jgi:hypothetical protein
MKYGKRKRSLDSGSSIVYTGSSTGGSGKQHNYYFKPSVFIIIFNSVSLLASDCCAISNILRRNAY